MLFESLESRRLLAVTTLSGRYVEALDRGVVAVNQGGGKVYVGWRLLASDPDDVQFNVYRTTGSTTTKLNASPLGTTTDLVTTGASTSAANSFFVRTVIDGVEQATNSRVFTLAAGAPAQPFLSVPLSKPADGVTPSGEAYTYSANDTSVADVDGDGQYELIVKWDPSNAKDNSQSGYTGNVYVDAYTLAGARLWRIDLGRNIRAGAHYTQFMAYDLDGDGKAEVAMKTGDGTVSGTGQVIGNAAADYRDHDGSDGRIGYVLSGPEYLTIFNGQTGAAMATTAYLPARGTVSSWGDNYGNRVDRFLAGVAYLDGVRPSLVMTRGYYTRTVLAAWDWRGGSLSSRWVFDSNNVSGAAGQGNHQLAVADVDQDGKDEIVFGAMTINDDGKLLYNTRLGHGDALHVSDMDPDRPGQEVFKVNESPSTYNAVTKGGGANLWDAKSGQIIFGVPATSDIGRGVAMDVDPRTRGYESWSSASGNLYDVKGNVVSTKRPSKMNFGIYWDADPLRELLDGTTIDKWNWTSQTTDRVSTLYNLAPISSNNSTKSTPNLSGDILGDWREEAVFRLADSSAMVIFTTTTPANFRLDTLTSDSQYRLALAWQNVAYNQPPHTSFYLGDGMLMRPAAPTGATAVASAGSIRVNWNAVAGATGYTVKRATSATGPFATVAANVGSPGWTDAAAAAGTTYYYLVTATNAAGGSLNSNAANARITPTATTPAAPASLAHTLTTAPRVALTWADKSNNETGFKVWRKLDNYEWSAVATTAANATSWTSSLLWNGSWKFRVTAINGSGESAPSNEVAFTLGATTPPPPMSGAPAAPTSLAYSLSAQKRVALTWADKSANETGFKVWRKLDNYDWQLMTTTAANATSWTSALLWTGNWRFRVTAINGSGESSPSNEVAFTIA